MLHTSKKGFSLIIALWLSLLFTLTWLFLMEFIVPFSRSTINIEHASIAQYQALSGIEHALRDISRNPPWHTTEWEEIGEGNRKTSYRIVWEGNIIPRPGTGNWIDPDWNRLSQSEPIQLLVWEEAWISLIEFRIRVPDFWEGTLRSLAQDNPLIIWQISSEKHTLIVDDSDIIKSSQVWSQDHKHSQRPSISSINIIHQQWIKNSNQGQGERQSFQDFYNDNCSTDTDQCVLRISLIDRLITDPSSSTDNELPFLEYQIQTDRSIPFQITDVSVTWTSYWFGRRYNIRVPQETTSAAFDYTVFQ